MGANVRATVTFVVLAVVLAVPQSGNAATVKTTTLADEFGGAEGTGCSLREAVQAANTNAPFGGCERDGAGADDVVKIRGEETYTISLPGVEDANAGGDLDVVGTLAIEPRDGGRATVDAGGIDRAIEVRPGSELTASRLVLTGGELGTTQWGGGVLSAGRLVLKSSVVTDNHIAAGGGSSGGGGVASLDGTATVLKRTIVDDNDADNLGAGGGVFQSEGVLTLRDTTVAENTAYGGGGIAVYGDIKVNVQASAILGNTARQEQYGGGGFYAYDGLAPTSPIRLTNVTISGNRSAGTGGGIHAAGLSVPKLNGVTLTLNIADFDADNAGLVSGGGGGVSGGTSFKNSIVAGNDGTNAGSEDCYQAFGGTHNVVGLGGGCANPDVGTSNPELGPLANNGGPTKTHALKAASPAVGRGGSSTPSRDQRGRHRDSDPDAGAYERGA